MADGKANFLMLVVTDVFVTILVVNYLDVIGRSFYHVVSYGHLNMADDVAILADGMATFFLLSLWQVGKSHSEITEDVTVADGKATV